ncbi:mechanosensitive ion channel family protein [Marivita sp. S2033]|uniref:mechanosensitive ion channel family protein n=1 Tax=Marivita sp. S2033 TaxID=3373187 RepID=UPI003981F85B
MEEIETVADGVWAKLTSMFTMEIYNGKSFADLLTLEALMSFAGNVVGAAVILILGFVISGILQRRIAKISERHPGLDDTLFSFLGDITRYTVLAFTALFVLNTFGVQTTSIVAVIGAAGLAIGLALQGTLSNVAAGVMLILFRPLKKGDFVQVNDVVGTVMEITLNYTEIADMGNVKVVVPNSEVWGNTIKNYSAYKTRRAEWEFGVGYGANLAQAEQVIRDTIMSDPRSHAQPEPFIQVNNLNASSVDFLVRVWCSSGDYFQYQADMKRAVKEALDAAGVDIPFPTRTVMVERSGDGEEDDTRSMAAQ